MLQVKAVALVSVLWFLPALIFTQVSGKVSVATQTYNDQGTCQDSNDDGYCDGTNPPQKCIRNVVSGKCHRTPE